MAPTNFASSDWAPAMKDASLTYTSFMAILFSLALMGVPHLAQGFGFQVDPSWQTISVSVMVLLAAAYIIIEALSDVFTRKSKILQSAPGTRWRFLTSLLILVVLIFGLMYSKLARSG